MNIVLTGMKHTGKSTIGAQLARKTGSRFVDTDDLVRELTGKSPRQLFDEGGPSSLAEGELRACEALAAMEDPVVAATGGALADNRAALERLRGFGTILYIDTPFDILFDRVMASAQRDGRLPRFLEGGDPRELFRALYQRRSEIYAQTADITVHAGRKPPQAIIREILEKLSHE